MHRLGKQEEETQPQSLHIVKRGDRKRIQTEKSQRPCVCRDWRQFCGSLWAPHSKADPNLAPCDRGGRGQLRALVSHPRPAFPCGPNTPRPLGFVKPYCFGRVGLPFHLSISVPSAEEGRGLFKTSPQGLGTHDTFPFHLIL